MTLRTLKRATICKSKFSYRNDGNFQRVLTNLFSTNPSKHIIRPAWNNSIYMDRLKRCTFMCHWSLAIVSPFFFLLNASKRIEFSLKPHLSTHINHRCVDLATMTNEFNELKSY